MIVSQKPVLSISLALTVGLGLSASAMAADYTWTGPNRYMEWASANWSGSPAVDPATGPTASDNYVGSTGNTAIALKGDRAINSFLQPGSQTGTMLIVSSDTAGSVSSVFTIGDLTNASSQLLTFRNGGAGNSLGLVINNLNLSGSANTALGSSGAANAIRSLNVTGTTTVSSNAFLLINVEDTEYSLGLLNLSSGEINLNHTSDNRAATSIINVTGLSGTGGSVRNARTNANNSSTLVIRNSANHTTSTTLDNGVGTLSVTKEGSGRQTLNGVNTYSGLTSVREGVLEIGSTGELTATSGVVVGGGATFAYNNSTQGLDATVTLEGNGRGNRARLAGNGVINSTLILDDVGDVLAAGDNGIGSLRFTASQAWSSFSYEWSITDFAGNVAGTDFDQIVVDGALNLNGTAGSYVLDLQSVDSAGISAIVANFSLNEADRSWVILTATGGITGFDADQWQIDSSGLLTDSEITGHFSLSVIDNDLVLTYAVPESSTVAFLIGAGALGAVLVMRRCRR